MQDLLTRGIDEAGNVRSEETHAFKDSALGRIPVEWEVKAIANLGNWRGGITPSKSNPTFWYRGTTLWLSPKDIKGEIISSSIDKITEEAIQKTSIKILNHSKSLVLVARSGVLKHSFPISTVEHPFTVNQDLKVLELSSETERDFVFQKLSSLKQYFLKTAVKVGTTVESIDMRTFLSIKVSVPCPTEQIRIQKKLSTSDRYINKLKKEEAKMSSLKTALMQDLLTGNKRVDDLLD
jgi:type I restriction enzyme S subunit